MAGYTSFPPSNQQVHHSVCISFFAVLFSFFSNLTLSCSSHLLAANGNSIEVPVLDDTGSSFLEIFDADRIALNIPHGFLQIHQPVTLVTASVPVQRSVVYLQAKLLDQTDSSIRGWAVVMAVVVLGPSNRYRCSGMFVRKSLFTATAPDVQRLLHVAEKKNGIITHLPVV